MPCKHASEIAIVWLLYTQSFVALQHRYQGKVQRPLDLVQIIINTPYINDVDPIFLVNAKDQNHIKAYLQNSISCVYKLSFEEVKTIWHKIIDLGNSLATFPQQKIVSL